MLGRLIFHCKGEKPEYEMAMTSPTHDRESIIFRVITDWQKIIVTQIWAIHALDSYKGAATYGIDKTTAVTVVRKGFKLQTFGMFDLVADFVLMAADHEAWWPSAINICGHWILKSPAPQCLCLSSAHFQQPQGLSIKTSREHIYGFTNVTLH